MLRFPWAPPPVNVPTGTIVSTRCPGSFVRSSLRSRLNLGLSVALLLCSCGQWEALQPVPPHPIPTDPYLIKVGDTLDVRFYSSPELNLLELPVRSDGKISLELLGDVQAAGMEPTTLARVLSDAYARELTNPRVTVIVRSFGGEVFVDGQVGAPTRVPYGVGLTALQAISAAGGFLESAKVSSVILIRKSDEQFQGYRLALQDYLEGKNPMADVRLQPSDIVHVPRSAVSNVNQFVKLYIRENIPIPVSIPLPAF